MPSNLDNYVCTKTLGEGAYGKVKEATDATGNKVAIKIFNKADLGVDKAIDSLKKEMAIYSTLSHPHMVNLIAYKEDAIWVKSDGRQIEVAYMVLELITGGQIFDFIADQKFDEKTCRYFFQQMLKAMHYIHSKGHAHRDLKPENIMMDDQFNIRIADFGFAVPIQGRDGSGFLKSKVGTDKYMAPEIILKKSYQGQSVDLFALGIILFIMYSGHPPFNIAHPKDLYYKPIAEKKFDLFWQNHQYHKTQGFYSEDFKALMIDMLQLNPQERLTMADIIGHPWTQGETATHEEVKEDFINRKKRVQEQREAEAAEKAAKKYQNQGVKRSGDARGKVEMSGDLESEDTKQNDIVDLREMGIYQEKAYKTSILFSIYNPTQIMNILLEKLKNKNAKYDLHEKKWKLNFQLEDDQDQDEQMADFGRESCIIQVKILQMADNKDLKAIEFTKLGGSARYFFEQFSLLKENLEF